MSRNKENNPLFSSHRNGHLHKNLPSEEFFTDSLLDESRLSNTSLIPSPSKAKTGPAKPRRALATTKALHATKETGHRSSRASLQEYTAARTKTHLKPSPKLSRRKSPSPLRTNGLSTPPRSRNDPPLNSPTEFSSPPGGLHESYQRIADEEDLAATEREVNSDEEGEEDDQHDTFEIIGDVNQPETVGSKGPLDEVRASQHSTPVRSPVDVDERTGSLSAPPTLPTLDFVQNEMSDRVLAAKLTHHVFDRAKDRARLDRLRQSVPITFGDKTAEHQVNGAHKPDDLASITNRGPISFDNVINGLHKSLSDTSADATSDRRIKAFSKAGRESSRQSHPDENDDGSDTPPELRQKERLVAFSKAGRRNKSTLEEDELQGPAPAPRLVAFSRSNGRPRPFVAPSEEEYDDQERLDDATQTSTFSEPLPGALPQRNQEAARVFLAKWRKETAERKASAAREKSADVEPFDEKAPPPETHTESQANRDDPESVLDWVAAGADVALPSIERSSTPRETPPPKFLPSPISKQRSLDRIRRWENDFTGMSFQVSESPPVRSRSNLNDSLREKEIEDLTKKAVTTNRLDEIRVKDPNVIVRKSSRNFTPEERRSAPPESQEQLPDQQDDEDRETRQAIPDTPIVVYRSSSQSTDKSKSSGRSMPDSLDQLQRLARAVSTTPRASPALQEMVREVEEASAISLPPSEEDPKAAPLKAPPNGLHRGLKAMDTPRVIGAWTDTILPDTVKTQKEMQRIPRYAQTPHVNAGGWINTPLANGERAPAVTIPEIVEEETEDVINDDVPMPADQSFKPRVEDYKIKQELINEAPPKAPPLNSEQSTIPASALTNVLSEAKQKRLVSRDITDSRPSTRDDTDTLNLGDTTIQSMEDLLTDAADITADLTNLIMAGAEEEVLALRQRNKLVAPSLGETGESSASEVAFIGHLTSRMERLMSNLHEARKGISRLEQKVSYSPTATVTGMDLQGHALLTSSNPTHPCTVCGRRNDNLTLHDHTHSASITSVIGLPIAYATFSFPVPLLFHPRVKAHPAQPQPLYTKMWEYLPGRPTWLGYLTIFFWTWYVLECIFTELYARPIYAERYVFPPPGVREPEFPFVLPTMLSRWVLGAYGNTLVALVLGLTAVLRRTVVAIYRVFGMTLGWSDGFVDDERNSIASATRVVAAKVAKSLMPDAAAADGLSMMNDEVL